ESDRAVAIAVRDTGGRLAPRGRRGTARRGGRSRRGGSDPGGAGPGGGGGGHGEEAATAVLRDPEGAVTRFDDPLVSTEYDREGRPRRIGVELWGSDADGGPLRGGGALIGPGAGVALLRFTLDGTPGTASYELVGPAE